MLLRYMDGMVLRHHEALLDEDYLANCYDSFYQLKNNGGLTLVSRAYFEFGGELIQLIANTLSQITITFEGDAFLVAARTRVIEGINKQKLFEKFLKCDTSTIANNIRLDVRQQLFQKLVNKAMHARHGMEINIYKRDSTKRGGDNHVGLALRTYLNAKAT